MLAHRRARMAGNERSDPASGVRRAGSPTATAGRHFLTPRPQGSPDRPSEKPARQRATGRSSRRKTRPPATRLTPPARLLHERHASDPGTQTPADSGPGEAVASEPRGKIALNVALSTRPRRCRRSQGGAQPGVDARQPPVRRGRGAEVESALQTHGQSRPMNRTGDHGHAQRQERCSRADAKFNGVDAQPSSRRHRGHPR